MNASALMSFDQLEKNYTLQAVSSPTYENNEMYWVGTSLSMAGVPLLIGEGELEEIIETPVCTAIPGTKSWVMGVAAHKGGLLPIISSDVLFRKVPYAGRPREYCMVIRRSGFHFGITLSHLERDMKFPIGQRNMAQSIDSDFADYCLGGFHHGEKFLAVLDIQKLVSESGLANAAAAERVSTEENVDE